MLTVCEHIHIINYINYTRIMPIYTNTERHIYLIHIYVLKMQHINKRVNNQFKRTQTLKFSSNVANSLLTVVA